MPNDCYDCPCYYEDKDMCEVFNKNTKADNGRPSWCPLKPMPQKYYKYGDDIEEDSYWSGWNECVDEITGDTECTTQKKDTSM